jgi:hypothetical protein
MTTIEPLGPIISKDHARLIASFWYNGQWSKLYSFFSSNFYFDADFSDYMAEIEACKPRTKEEIKELNQLTTWFKYKNWEHANK